MRIIVHFSTELKVTIRPDYRPAPGEDPGELGPNEFTAGSVFSLNCDVQGNSGSVNFEWIVTGSDSSAMSDSSDSSAMSDNTDIL